MIKYHVDPKCSELAYYFMSYIDRSLAKDSEPVKELASAIQGVCEDRCTDWLWQQSAERE
jgi:hypothetical protein